MPDANHCPECGAPLPADWPKGLCSRCALEGALNVPGGESQALQSHDPDSPESRVRSPKSIQPAEKPGDRIGHYRLLQQIGEGGCGIVYMAEQEEPVRRRVALKVIKLGMDTRQVIARFEAERQALAMMDHPNIAKIFDAGVTEASVVGQASRLSTGRLAPEPANTGETPFTAGGTPAPLLSPGRPYFVMELVRGIKITEYCDENKLSTRERLDLFIQVCQAVQHAHQKGIIHRDIKPSNILVTINDGVRVPKVIDFGVAKATGQQRLTDKTLFTAFEQFIGTPAYMSPEQALMTSLDIDTRSDIYSLGVLLYELLTGRTPFDSKELLAAGLDEIRRTIREKEPARPSTRLSTLHEGELTTAAERRRTDPPKLVHQLRGDLDWIVMKCLEKDRTRRYETANGLARDIERHLSNEAVVARPPSKLYRFQKLARRNKLAFAAAGAVTAALIIGLGISTVLLVKEKQARERAVAAEHAAEAARASESAQRQQAVAASERARAAEKKAETEAARSTQEARFMKDMLKGVGPRVAQGRDTMLLREILDHTAQRLKTDLTNQPEVEADLRETLGVVYRDLSELTNAAAMLKESLALRRKLYGNEHLDVASSLQNLGEVYRRQWKDLEAEAAFQEALAIRRKLLGNEHLDVAASLYGLAETLRRGRQIREGETLHREALAMRRKLGAEPLDVASSLTGLGITVRDGSKLAESETHLREALAMRRKEQGDSHPDVAYTLSQLGRTLGRMPERLAEAETILREAVAIQTSMLGEQANDTRNTLGTLQEVLAAQGRLAEAEEIVRQQQITTRKLFGESRLLVLSLANLSELLRRQGKLSDADATEREALAVQRRLFNSGVPDATFLPAQLLSHLRGQGKFDEAESLCREALAVQRKALGDEHRWVLQTLTYLSDILVQEHKPAEAAAILQETLTVQRKILGEGDELALALNDAGNVLHDLGRYVEAEVMHRESLALRRKLHGNEHADVGGSLANLTRVLLDHGKFDDALPMARECLAIREKKIPDHWRRYNAESLVGGSLVGQGKYAEAEPLLLSAYAGMKQREATNPANDRRHLQEALQRALKQLVKLYEATGRPGLAAEWKQKLEALEQAAK